jgi:hypothetical protein
VRKLRESLKAEAIAVLRETRQATDQVWQRLAAHNPSPELGATVEELKTHLASESFIDSWDEIATGTRTVLEAYRNAYCELFDRRKKSYESAIGEIKNRTEWGPLEANNPGMAATLLSPLQGRIGTDEDEETVQGGTSLGRSSLTEMESDLAAVDEIVGLGQVARTLDRQREKGADPKGAGVRVLQPAYSNAGRTRKSPRPPSGFASEVHR